MSKIKVTLKKSLIGGTESMRRNVESLGLKKINSCAIHNDTPGHQGDDPCGSSSGIRGRDQRIKEGIAMNLHEIKPPEGAKRGTKRIGRGIGSGHGKTLYPGP